MGCSKKRRVLNSGVNVSPVLFESDVGRDIFVDEIRERYDDGDAELPPGTLSKHAYFNRETANADEDGDGILSDREVQSYVDQ